MQRVIIYTVQHIGRKRNHEIANYNLFPMQMMYIYVTI